MSIAYQKATVEHSVSNCKLQEEVVADIEAKLKEKKIRKFRLQIYYDILVLENDKIISEMQTTLGMQLASLAITMPTKDLEFLGEVAMRSLGYFVGEEIIKKAQALGKSLSAVRKNIEDNQRMRKENQEEIEKLSKDLELVKEDLRECKAGAP